MYRTLVLRFDARILVLVGALLVMVAVALPWVNLPSFLAGAMARQGVAGGGLLTLGLAVLAAFSLLLPWRPLRRVALPAACLAVLIDLVALAALVRVVQLATTLKLDWGAQLGSVGSGLYLTFAGVLLMLIGGLTGDTPPVSYYPQGAFGIALDSQTPPWLGYVGWLVLVVMLLASCLCAWGLGWLVQPDRLAVASQAKASPMFAPAPTTYLATPLVDVHLAPLGSASTSSAPSPTQTRPGATAPTTAAPLSALPTVTLPVSPTLRPSTPTRQPTPALPVTNTVTPPPPPTPTLPTSPLATPTATASHTPTPTVTVSATPTLTATATLTPTASPTR